MNEFTQMQLVRLISDMIQIGIIIDVQVKPLRYRVRFTPDLYTHWIPANVGHAGKVRDWEPLQKGEQVLVLKQFNTQNGVIIASLNQKSFDQPKDELDVFYREFPDGTWLQYDMKHHELSGQVKGKVSLDAETEIRMASPKIILIGDIEHQGKQTTTGNISSGASISAANNISDSVRSMADDREIFNRHDHFHGDPKTSVPNQKQ
ncbi:phage baseplate assembly protein V [Vibrio spartinae]|uniref:Phage-related baseplate assembly protein n=1 Tax=Vibrio spartinae TaxID=1918945 RepID=A0A1N6M5J8_9VIBR|nr:phage baseplate assembly protein V [Vibrio spartinae]SIO94660.1 Phage-related baseplate assembly protein [Vibrio spartinae]